MKKISLIAVKSATKIIKMRRGIEHNPQKHLSNTTGGVLAHASQPPDPHCLASLISCFILQMECCMALHPLGGAGHTQKRL
jgi:hypothetical protein